MDENVRLLIERVNLRTLLLSLVAFVVGVGVMFSSQSIDAAGYHKTAALLREGGAALCISVALAVLWDLAGKRAFADEILAKAGMSRDLADAGIEVVSASFQDERIRWDQLFKNSCKLDMFISYGHTWRNTHLQQLDKLLSDEDAKLRVVLPDPNDQAIVEALAVRFESDPEKVKQDIEQATAFFKQRKERAKGTVEIYHTRIEPLFSFYRFNHKAVFALYNHRLGRIPVPVFVCDADGFLFDYLTEEFEGIRGDKQRTRPADAEQGTATED
jgi:hypothetical protein